MTTVSNEHCKICGDEIEYGICGECEKWAYKMQSDNAELKDIERANKETIRYWMAECSRQGERIAELEGLITQHQDVAWAHSVHLGEKCTICSKKGKQS